MGLTWDERNKLRLTWREIEQLGLTWNQWDNITYDELLKLLKIKLERFQRIQKEQRTIDQKLIITWIATIASVITALQGCTPSQPAPKETTEQVIQQIITIENNYYILSNETQDKANGLPNQMSNNDE